MGFNKTREYGSGIRFVNNDKVQGRMAFRVINEHARSILPKGTSYVIRNWRLGIAIHDGYFQKDIILMAWYYNPSGKYNMDNIISRQVA